MGILMMGFALLLVGCSGDNADGSKGAMSASQGTSISESGTLLLKVNPEIAIDYDENGKVTRIIGINEDGTDIISQYPDYIGKDSGLVLKELIALIGEAGYFVEEVEGEARKIIIELEAGSALPGESFLEVMAANAQHAVEEYKLNSNVEVDGETYISLDDAKKIAFEHAKVDGTKAKFDDQEFDLDDGVPSYELEFMIDGNEYEYDIHAVSGEVLKYEHDLKDKKEAEKPVAPAKSNDDSGYDDSAYDKKETPAQKPAAKPATKKAEPAPAPKTAPKTETKKATPAPKAQPKKSAPAAKPAPTPTKSRKDDSDYDDSDYDDSDYDDSDYDDSDYDDSDYDDSDYDDSDYD